MLQHHFSLYAKKQTDQQIGWKKTNMLVCINIPKCKQTGNILFFLILFIHIFLTEYKKYNLNYSQAEIIISNNLKDKKKNTHGIQAY